MAVAISLLGFNGWSVAGVIVGAFLWLSSRFLSVRMDAREPPLIRSTVPYIGHMLSMLQHQFAYLTILSSKHLYPAFTINLLSSKVYVVTHPALVQAALRCKTMNFDPFVLEFASSVLGLSKAGMAILEHVSENEKEESYMQNAHRLLHENLLPGRSLLEMNAKVLGNLAGFVNEVGSNWETIDLYVWLRDCFTLSGTRSLYGPKDPISANPNLINSLLDFETNILALMTGVRLLNPKAYRGREALQAAFRKYYHACYDNEASPLVRERAISARRYGLSDDDMGNIELSILHVTTTNAIPSIFWFLCYVFADPQLLSDIRNEVMSIIEMNSGDGERECEIDITKFNSDCPLLVSAYHESLRLQNAQVSARVITDDTILSFPVCAPVDGHPESFLLKKGAIIQMPAGVSHTSTAVWGADAHAFDARRFLPSTKESLDKESRKLQSQGLFPFGGGKHLCPGRYFALAEILGMVSVLVAGFELVQVSPGCDRPVRISVPEAGKQRFGEVIKKPKHDIKVKIRRRGDLEDVRWGFRVGTRDCGYDAFQRVF